MPMPMDCLLYDSDRVRWLWLAGCTVVPRIAAVDILRSLPTDCVMRPMPKDGGLINSQPGHEDHVPNMLGCAPALSASGIHGE